MQDVSYGPGGALGLARTWPQAAGCLPHAQGTPFDWESDRPLNLPMRDLIIYEAHVRGFTWDATSGVSSSGTSFKYPQSLLSMHADFACLTLQDLWQPATQLKLLDRRVLLYQDKVKHQAMLTCCPVIMAQARTRP